jgi:hypothetical protein
MAAADRDRHGAERGVVSVAVDPPRRRCTRGCQPRIGAWSGIRCQDTLMAPFAGTPAADFTCTVKPGTKIFVAAWSAECSTLEVGPPPTFFGKA